MKIVRLIITLFLTVTRLHAADEQSSICSLRLQAAKVIARQLIIGRANDDTPMKTPHGIMPLGAIPQDFKDTIQTAKRLVIKDIARALKHGEITEASNVDGVAVTDFVDEAKEGIAKEYYFLCKGRASFLPKWLKPYFNGVSVQDLLDNNLCPEIDSFSNLRSLELPYKNLHSLNGLQKVPGIETVQKLDVSNNKLTALPEAIGSLVALKQLRLERNCLACLPEEIGYLTALQKLLVSNNKLTALPESICNLTALQQLRLETNCLACLPEEIGYLTALQKLWVPGNTMTALPKTIGTLTVLQYLNVFGNKLTTLPVTVGYLTALQHLWLSNNELTVLPKTIGNLTALQTLYLEKNCLESLPREVGNLTALQQLYVSFNKLTVLPEGIGSLTALQELEAYCNELTVLPKTIGYLTALQHLWLSNNELTTLPEAIANLIALQELYVSGNRLSKQEIASLREKFEECSVALYIGNQFPELADVAAQAASSQ